METMGLKQTELLETKTMQRLLQCQIPSRLVRKCGSRGRLFHMRQCWPIPGRLPLSLAKSFHSISMNRGD